MGSTITIRDRLRNLVGGKPEPEPAPPRPAVPAPPPGFDRFRTSSAVVPAAPRPQTPVADIDFMSFVPKSFSSEPEAPVDEAELAKLEAPLLAAVRTVLDEAAPSFPWFANEVLEAAEKPDVEIAEMTKLVSRDPLIAAQVLKVANSAQYSRGTKVADLRDAINRVGLREVAGIAAIASAQALMSPSLRWVVGEYPGVWRRVWTHAIATSIATAGWLASNLGGVRAPSAFLGGLLHDVGKMVALQGFGAALKSRRVPRLTGRQLSVLIEKTHLEIGVRVAKVSGFPESVLQMCRDHHAAPGEDAAQHRELNTLVVVAVMEEVLAGMPPDAAWIAAAVARARLLRIDSRLAGGLATVVREAREKAETILAAA
jgi:putative nucleotidyltransferase with HDIG domain